MQWLRRNQFKKKGQTVTELAIFGSILIFVLGVIIRQSLSAHYQQNQQLKALRLALMTSYLHTEGLEGQGGGVGSTSRNTASVVIVEDRLAADTAKYASIDRLPQLVTATATHSRNLFMPVDEGEEQNVPRMDMYVNGKHFIFTLGKFVTYNVTSPDNNNVPLCEDVEWEDQCAQFHSPQEPDTDECSDDAPANCVRCMKWYYAIPNAPAVSDWCNCDDGDAVCDDLVDGLKCPPGNFTAQQRFDLDRDGTTDVPSDQPEETIFARVKFAWQWFLIKAFNEDSDHNFTKLIKGPDTGTPIAEGVSLDNDKNTFVDVDCDNKEERIMKIIATNSFGVIEKVLTLDFQSGDLDLSISTGDDKPLPGFTQEIQMWTFIDTPDTEPAFLEIREGELFGPGNQWVRSVQKNDTVDLRFN